MADSARTERRASGAKAREAWARLVGEMVMHSGWRNSSGIRKTRIGYIIVAGFEEVVGLRYEQSKARTHGVSQREGDI